MQSEAKPFFCDKRKTWRGWAGTRRDGGSKEKGEGGSGKGEGGAAKNGKGEGRAGSLLFTPLPSVSKEKGLEHLSRECR